MSKTANKAAISEPQTELEKQYPIHPIANLFPMMEEKEIESLTLDIKENGLQEPIVTFGGYIVDGRNRFQACLKSDVKPVFQAFEEMKTSDGKLFVVSDDNLRNFVFARNLHRRHLSKDQKEEMAKRLRKDGWSQDKICNALRVSIGTINKWVKDVFKNENVKTRTDSAGRNQPLKHKEREVVEPTEEEKVTTAKEALEAWVEEQKENGLPFLTLKDIAKEVLEIK